MDIKISVQHESFMWQSVEEQVQEDSGEISIFMLFIPTLFLKTRHKGRTKHPHPRFYCETTRASMRHTHTHMDCYCKRGEMLERKISQSKVRRQHRRRFKGEHGENWPFKIKVGYLEKYTKKPSRLEQVSDL